MNPKDPIHNIGKPKPDVSAIDMQAAWSQCCGKGDAPDWFHDEMAEIFLGYSFGPDTFVSISAKDRNKFYKRIETASRALLETIEDLPPRIEFELQNTFSYNEPENIEEVLVGEYEGLTYGEYEIDRLIKTLKVFQKHAVEARDDYMPSHGRPKQNESLERIIVDLGGLYEKISGKAPMVGLTYQELDSEMPYQGQFMIFVTQVFWACNGRKVPTNPTLGDAARRAFGVRK